MDLIGTKKINLSITEFFMPITLCRQGQNPYCCKNCIEFSEFTRNRLFTGAVCHHFIEAVNFLVPVLYTLIAVIWFE